MFAMAVGTYHILRIGVRWKPGLEHFDDFLHGSVMVLVALAAGFIDPHRCKHFVRRGHVVFVVTVSNRGAVALDAADVLLGIV